MTMMSYIPNSPACSAKVLKLTELIKAVGLNWRNAEPNYESGTSLDYEFEINPEDFLEYAKQDIKDGGERSLVNAISNAKRAIDCQTDKVLKCLGFETKRMTFSTKFKVCQDLGLITPRIVRKVVGARNYLEHEYRRPGRERTRDALDVATLYIDATNSVLQAFPEEFTVDQSGTDEKERERTPSYFVHFDSDKHRLSVSGYNGNTEVGEITLTPLDEEYIVVMRLVIAVKRETGFEDAMRRFVDLSK
jgi:hypothetical protein